jgi:hypothetical protein
MSYRLGAIITLAGLALAVPTVPASAATITSSGSAPTGAAIAQSDFSAAAFSGAQDFSDNAGPPGQTFTPNANLSLTAVTVKGFANTSASFGGLVAGTNFTITISQVAAGSLLTNLRQETADAAPVTDGSAYLTFNLAAPVPLVAGTQYEYDVSSSAGYFGFAKSSADVYVGGAAVQHGSTGRTSLTGAAITNPQAVDRTFFITATAIPEPGSIGMVAVALVGLLGRRRHVIG